MKILLGVGNELRGDDGIGPHVAQSFSADGWKSIDCSTVPENYTGVVKREGPGSIVIIDSADMGLEPGEVRVIPKEKIGGLAISTHSMPLSLLIDHLEESCKDITLIGVQPKQVGDFLELSDEAKKAAQEIIQALKTGTTLSSL
ncbi:hydrogenase maturation peptidase HycI [archaeon]